MTWNDTKLLSEMGHDIQSHNLSHEDLTTLIWQVGGLAFLLYVGSPQSKEGQQRLEEKMDVILQKVDPEGAQEIIEQLKKEYPEK